MGSLLIIASTVISLALVAYTIGVFSERRAGELKPAHLAFFWLGLACDTTGTTITTIMAQGSGGAASEAARGWKRPFDDVGIFEICRFSLITQRIHAE